MAVITLFHGVLLCQQLPDTPLPTKRRVISGLPVVFYTPETRFGFGATSLLIFNWKNDTINAARSSMSMGFAFTQNKQVLSYLPFNLFLKNREYQVYGELAYNKYHYNFYGVGNEVPQNYVERYGVEFPRLRITGLKKLIPHFYAGLRYAYDKFTLFDLDTSAILGSGKVPGANGGVISGPGVVLMYDNRDNVFYPSRGIWTELVVFRNDKFAGGTFNYTRIAFDFCKYFSYKKNILALNVYSMYSDVDLPFFQMAMLGGAKKLRGFYEGRYRDNNGLVFQAEYRRHLFWLCGITLFADAGQVAHRFSAFTGKNWKYTYGAGLRLMLDKAQKINLRLDLAVGNNKLLTYFTVAEAF